MKQIEYFGYGKIKKVKNILKKEKVKNIFLVCGKNSFKLSGAGKKLLPLIKNYNFLIFNDLSSSPKIEEIKKGFKKFEKNNLDIILAIGGGSVIDTAKAIKLFYFKKYKKNIPLIAIPTTSGTGSEATYFIVYYKNKKKISVGEKKITLPKYVILDFSLILNLPKKIKASSAMDAFSQAIESYWSVNSNEKSKKFSKKTIKLILANVSKSVNKNNKKSNAKLMLAANLSGKAINISKTTASHAISYPLTSYFHIPHGQAVIITLPEVFEYNSKINEENCNDKRGYKYVKKTIKELLWLMRVKNISDSKKRIKKLVSDIGLETKLRDLGVCDRDFSKIIKNINLERLNNNPRKLNQKDIKEILKRIY